MREREVDDTYTTDCDDYDNVYEEENKAIAKYEEDLMDRHAVYCEIVQEQNQ